MAVWLAVLLFAPAPSEALAAAVARTATGQIPHNLAGPMKACNDLMCDEDWYQGGDQVMREDQPLFESDHLDDTKVGYWIPQEDIPAWIAEGRRRLVAAGWQVDPLERQYAGDGGTPDFWQFTARTSDLQVRMWAFGESAWAGPDVHPVISPPAAIVVQRHRPPGLPVVSVAAFGLGLLPGWLLAGSIVGACRRGRRPVLLVVSAFTVLVPAVLLEGLVLMAGLLVLLNPAGVSPASLLLAPVLLTIPGLAFATVVVTLGALLTRIAVALAPPRRLGPGYGRSDAAEG